MENNLISIKNVSFKHFKKFILNPISFGINKKVISVLGPLNSGKEELLLILSNNLSQNSGKIEFNYKIKIGLSPVGDYIPLIKNFSVIENLDYFSRLNGEMKNKKYFLARLKDFELSSVYNHLVSDLDDFHISLLRAAIGFLNDPDLVLLSSPTKDITEQEARVFWEIIFKNLKDKYLVFTTLSENEAKKYSLEVIKLK